MKTVPVEVSRYIEDIRVALADLSAEDIDDLTQGMEADLIDVASESRGSLRDRLGTPEEYAAELRSAAGLAPRTAEPGARRSAISDARERLRDLGERAVDRWPWLRDLRVTWWLLRGAVAAWVFCGLFQIGQSPVLWFIGAACSFMVGKVSEGWGRWQRRGITIGNTLAAVLVLPFLASALSSSDWHGPYAQMGYQPTPGLAQDGDSVSNLYVYDAAGNRVDRARVYDQDGRPLRVDPGFVPFTVDPGSGHGVPPQGPIEVFPHTEGDFDGWAGVPAPGGPVQWSPPAAIPPLLPAPSGTTAPPTPGPSATEPSGGATTPTQVVTSAPVPPAATAPPTRSGPPAPTPTATTTK